MRFRYIQLFLPLHILLIVGCQKKTSSEPEVEVQGNHFNILQKTIAENVNGGGLKITTNYTYNTAGQVAEIKRQFESASGTSQQKDLYHRSANGRLDSISYIKLNNPPASGVYKTEFYYDNNGFIVYSVNRTNTSSYPTDSVRYSYQSNRLVQRIVYRTPYNSPSYTVTITFSYNYDQDGNLSRIDVIWSNPSISNRNCTYTYDGNTNPLPVMEYENELYGNWIKGFDNNFTTPNNILSRRTSQSWDWDWGDKDYEYRYSTNNKPLYQKVKHTGTTGFYEMRYYYD